MSYKILCQGEFKNDASYPGPLFGYQCVKILLTTCQRDITRGIT